MMIQYFFIPKKYEKMLADAVTKFLKNPKAWTMITGEYEESPATDISDSLVINKDKKGNVKSIKKGLESHFTGQKFKLIGFCVVGNLKRFVPDFYAELLKISDVLIFNSAAEYRNAINVQYQE